MHKATDVMPSCVLKSPMALEKARKIDMKPSPRMICIVGSMNTSDVELNIPNLDPLADHS